MSFQACDTTHMAYYHCSGDEKKKVLTYRAFSRDVVLSSNMAASQYSFMQASFYVIVRNSTGPVA